MLGGYTTFSTFGLDTHVLVQTHSSQAALAYVAANMIGGLAAVWLGYAIGLRAA
jgi:CrcB protein